MSDRDTQFAGFAEKLYEEQLEPAHAETVQEFRSHQVSIIARRAYDLVEHTLCNVSPRDLDVLSTQECLHRIPDLTTFPAEAETPCTHPTLGDMQELNGDRRFWCTQCLVMLIIPGPLMKHDALVVTLIGSVFGEQWKHKVERSEL